MIRFGPAGIPLSCKGRTLRDGIEDVHNLSLSALEIQMVRAGVFARPPEDEEIGGTIRDIQEDFVVEIMRDGDPINDPDEPIDEEDDLLFMPSPVADTFGELGDIGYMAKRLDVKLSIHTPYYMDLGGEDEMAMSCFDSLRHAAIILNALDGDIVVTSLGIYDGERDPESVEENIRETLEALMGWWKANDIRCRLGVEITGQPDVYGSLEQVLDLCADIGDIVPVINFPHQHSRTNGTLLDTDDFLDLMETVQPYAKGGLHTAFSGVEYEENIGEKRLTPIKKGDLKFEPLAEALAEMRPDCTVISTSPLLEHDAMYMKIIQERVLTKRAAKDLKERRKSEKEAAASAGE